MRQQSLLAISFTILSVKVGWQIDLFGKMLRPKGMEHRQRLLIPSMHLEFTLLDRTCSLHIQYGWDFFDMIQPN